MQQRPAVADFVPGTTTATGRLAAAEQHGSRVRQQASPRLQQAFCALASTAPDERYDVAADNVDARATTSEDKPNRDVRAFMSIPFQGEHVELTTRAASGKADHTRLGPRDGAPMPRRQKRDRSSRVETRGQNGEVRPPRAHSQIVHTQQRMRTGGWRATIDAPSHGPNPKTSSTGGTTTDTSTAAATAAGPSTMRS